LTKSQAVQTDEVSAWHIYPGRDKVFAAIARNRPVVGVRFRQLPLLDAQREWDQMFAEYVDSTKKRNEAMAFVYRMQLGDLAVMPFPDAGYVAIGDIRTEPRVEWYPTGSGGETESWVVRTVSWRNAEVARELFRDKKLNSLLSLRGATVKLIDLPKIVSRLDELVQGKPDPGPIIGRW
jgi:predicted Mrr-cat superfamily restriction endonuclease